MSAEIHKDAGRTAPIAPQKPEGALSRVLNKVVYALSIANISGNPLDSSMLLNGFLLNFSARDNNLTNQNVSNSTQPSDQEKYTNLDPEIERQASLFENTFNVIDKERAEQRASELLLREQLEAQRREAFAESKRMKMEELGSIEEYMSVVDPLLSAAMLTLARKTWGNGFKFSKYLGGLSRIVEGVAPLSGLFLFKDEEYNFEVYSNSREDNFCYSIGGGGGSYGLEVIFLNGKPQLLKLLYNSHHEIDLKDGQELPLFEDISCLLADAYKQGPYMPGSYD